MRNTWFPVFIFILFSCFLAFHGYVRAHFNSGNGLEKHIAILEEKKHQAEFRQQLAQAELNDFKAQVATLLPSAIQETTGSKGYPLRQLASVVSKGEPIQFERASSLFEKAKAQFREKNFEDANVLFNEVIERFPESIHVIEAHFLLVEGYYQLREDEKAVDTVETMISLFPESELTGFALMRLGKIFEKQDRLEDAAEIYRAVLANFNQPEIRTQAETALKAVAL